MKNILQVLGIILALGVIIFFGLYVLMTYCPDIYMTGQCDEMMTLINLVKGFL